MIGRGRERLVDLDLLRLLAIVLVVSRIAVEDSFDPPEGSPLAHALLVVGFLGVSTFFFISGYLLQRGYPSIATSADARLFFSRRAWRIFPLYWVALLVFLLLSRLVIEPGSEISVGALLAHVLGLQEVLYPAYIDLLLLWFIGAIVVFYLVYPLLVYRRPAVARLLVRALAIFLLMGVVKAGTGLFAGSLFEYFPVFVLGVAAGTTGFLRDDRYRPWRLVLAVVAVPAIGFAYLSHGDIGGLEGAGELSPSVVMTVGRVVGARLVAALCFVFLAREAYVLLAPRSPRVLYLITAGATASYAVYLFHGPWLAVVATLVGGPPATVFAASAASLPVLFVVCYYVQTATDRLIAPVRRRRPRESNGR